MSDIPKLVLDPRNEEDIVEQMIARTYIASDGLLSDFTAGNAVRAIFEGQAYAQAEMLYYLNLLPEALALEVMRLAGVNRALGAKSLATLTFRLSAPLNTVFFLPLGYSVPWSTTAWVLQTSLTIPAGTLSATVACESAKEGTLYNVPSFAINITNPGLNFVSSIYNADASTGGLDIESVESLVSRSNQALRYRNTLVTAEDLEEAVRIRLGFGSVAKCVPLLTASKDLYKPGHAHLFCLGAGLTVPSQALLSELQRDIRARSFIGSSIWVSSISLMPVEMGVSILVDTFDYEINQRIFDAMERYFDPSTYELGQAVVARRTSVVVGSVQGVVEVFYTGSAYEDDIGNQVPSLALTSPWHTPKLVLLNIGQTNKDGDTFSSNLSFGLGDQG